MAHIFPDRHRNGIIFQRQTADGTGGVQYCHFGTGESGQTVSEFADFIHRPDGVDDPRMREPAAAEVVIDIAQTFGQLQNSVTFEYADGFVQIVNVAVTAGGTHDGAGVVFIQIGEIIERRPGKRGVMSGGPADFALHIIIGRADEIRQTGLVEFEKLAVAVVSGPCAWLMRYRSLL